MKLVPKIIINVNGLYSDGAYDELNNMPSNSLYSRKELMELELKHRELLDKREEMRYGEASS